MSALYGHRLLRHNCGSWAIDDGRTKQGGMQEAVYDRSRHLQILMAKGPSGPRIGRKQVLILPAGDYTKAKGTHPRKKGAGGKVTMSARYAKALIGAVPRRFFRAFLIVQKGTSSPPQGGTLSHDSSINNNLVSEVSTDTCTGRDENTSGHCSNSFSPRAGSAIASRCPRPTQSAPQLWRRSRA